MSVLRVAFAGPHVSIQDGGRPKFMRYGVPASGPMDRASFSRANRALGNAPDAAGIEVSPGGLSLTGVEGTVHLAIVGGGFRVARDGRSLPSAGVVALEPGQNLTIRPGAWGSWTYVAFAGALRSARWLDSAATLAAAGFGGGALVSGQILEIDAASASDLREGALPDPEPPGDAPLRVVLGPQDRYFSQDAVARLLGEPFAVTDAFDRMGVRLSGPDLKPAGALDIPSEALLRGSIQVAGDGVASVMLSDHGTTGGYPKIATVIAPDVDRLAQRRPGDPVRFSAISPQEAVAAAREAARAALAPPPTLDLAAALLAANLIDGVVSADG